MEMLGKNQGIKCAISERKEMKGKQRFYFIVA